MFIRITYSQQARYNLSRTRSLTAYSDGGPMELTIDELADYRAALAHFMKWQRILERRSLETLEKKTRRRPAPRKD
jgi:hypothetical protein